jgi:hypothetical protein
VAEIRNGYKILVGNHEGKRSLGGYRRRYVCVILKLILRKSC